VAACEITKDGSNRVVTIALHNQRIVGQPARAVLVRVLSKCFPDSDNFKGELNQTSLKKVQVGIVCLLGSYRKARYFIPYRI
jgi:hypothetical protein